MLRAHAGRHDYDNNNLPPTCKSPHEIVDLKMAPVLRIHQPVSAGIQDYKITPVETTSVKPGMITPDQTRVQVCKSQSESVGIEWIRAKRSIDDQLTQGGLLPIH